MRPRDTQAFWGGNHRRINGAQREIAVAVDEFGNADPVSGGYGCDSEGAAGEVAQEAHLRLDPQPGRQQIVHWR